ECERRDHGRLECPVAHDGPGTCGSEVERRLQAIESAHRRRHGCGEEESTDEDPAHLKASRKSNTAGPSKITNMAGKIRKTSGKRIFTGALSACASAAARQTLRIR